MTDMNVSGIVFDTQSFSVHDGPGIRTLVFLKGCPLRCKWCANPEGQFPLPEKRYFPAYCRGCLSCMAACPNDAVSVVEEPTRDTGFVAHNREICLQCRDMQCLEACPERAIRPSGRRMTVGEVMRIIRREIPYYKGVGGITLSGGEPLTQPEFAAELLKACKEEMVNTCIESAMHVPWKHIEAVLPYTDYWLVDIKHMDSDKHREGTHVPNTTILENIARLTRERPGQVVIRVPVIPGFNDTVENMEATGRFARDHNVSRVNLLPYHKLGQVKYNQIGMEYPMPDVAPPSKEHMEELRQAVERQGVMGIVN